MGVPYKRKYSTDSYYPIYLDCCGLIRRVCLDLAPELGFTIGGWNQGYQVDTCPIVLKKRELKPGDLIFYSAIYHSKTKKVSKHNMVHVEMYLGGETGEQSIGARKKRGVIQIFDSFKFESKGYYNIKFHFRSLDTWLKGTCKSVC